MLILRHHQRCVTIDSEFQTAPDRIYVKFNKCLFIVVCFPQIRNTGMPYIKPTRPVYSKTKKPMEGGT